METATPLILQIRDITEQSIGQRVQFKGWARMVHEVGKKTFFTVYSGGYLVKCIYKATEERLHLTKHTSVVVTGTVKANFTKDQFPCEVDVETCEIFGGKVAPGFEISKDTSESIMWDHAHLLIREPERAAVLLARAELLKIIREYYNQSEYVEITPPTLVQTQVEGGSTLFELDYFNEPAFLTQSSQLYLETVVPVFDKSYCIASSYRAEKSSTRRHLSEYTHIEAELAWIEFDQLLDSIEELLISIISGFNIRCLPIIKRFGLEAKVFPVPDKGFPRVTHREAIDILRASGKFMKDDGSQYTYDDDIPDLPERYICQHVGQGKPVFMTHFPAHLKSFYMAKDADGTTLSCDLLFPEVGEIVGGSMRIHNYDELVAGFERENISPAPYTFYTDQALYGPCPHGGYGLGFERIIMGLLPELVSKVRFACLYPRFLGRCTP
ncbi:asparaginyl-tRNA synthetase [Nematocida homosporus]|uniref:asparaginyl-tRNA synthetase n=1 Tax=Nematocida homosporus TaxID=1912981 RepID=UPI002220C527|nr:asparaginyl-tRNA synthetase [Nematocida homosporus]KAI5185377.1 asparaginyl-tRNA synthetase [Nematocida homosporus]